MPAARREETIASLGEAFGVTDFSSLAREMLTWDQLRAPFVGLCGKALFRRVEPAWFALDPFAQQAECDAWLAESLVARAASLTPRAWSPLPLLGIPGVTPDNEAPAYYRDTRQFRPPRGAGRRAVLTEL